MPGLAQTRARIVAQVLAGFLLTLMASKAAAESARPLPRPDGLGPAGTTLPAFFPQEGDPVIVTMSSRSPAQLPDFVAAPTLAEAPEKFMIDVAAIANRLGALAIGPARRAESGPASPVIDAADIADLDGQIAALVARPPRHLRGASPLACLAVSIYHEARDQSELGQKAVASVILRRAEVEGRWGDTICDVVQPVQFSYLRSDRSFGAITEAGPWRQALELAAGILVEGPVPTLAEADHYHATYVAPRWRRAMRRIARIGDHVFYRDPASRAAD